jgi:hypothetical protein
MQYLLDDNIPLHMAFREEKRNKLIARSLGAHIDTEKEKNAFVLSLAKNSGGHTLRHSILSLFFLLFHGMKEALVHEKTRFAFSRNGYS